jgi:hypothetical protein
LTDDRNVDLRTLYQFENNWRKENETGGFSDKITEQSKLKFE